MNRLIIVGNGFDLAHGLPTGYCDFIDWYWGDVISKIKNSSYDRYEDEIIYIEFDLRSQDSISFQTLNELKKVKGYHDLKTLFNIHNKQIRSISYHKPFLLKLKNTFFDTICEHSIQNWVDIENEYYKLLKDCLKEENNSKVKKLNEEFNEVKNLLEKYLFEEVCLKVNFKKLNNQSSNFLNHFIVRSKNSKELTNYLEEFPQQDRQQLLEKEVVIADTKPSHLKEEIWSDQIKEHNLFLNFNYTYSLDKYVNFINSGSGRYAYGLSTLIQIHGRLNNKDNKINFGFGDEMDKHYQEIEEKDDNEYLKYIKSFQYSQNSNYKKVLDFIDSDKFQVYIMGHSCGLSDRILLNTVFEHENCRSIKVFYHQKDDGTDNYTEIVQNISRHFNKKKMMRDKIVNKSLCQPLPQDIRFEAK